ncbi:MoaF-related domain-containing protein [Lonsdalea iberica]
MPDDYYLICWQEDDKSTVVHGDNFVKKLHASSIR